MDVEDRLAGLAIRVEDSPVTAVVVSALLGDGGRAPDHLAHERIVLGVSDRSASGCGSWG